MLSQNFTHGIFRIAIISAFFFCSLPLLQSQTIIYVNTNAVGANNGTNWFNAYNSLQDALDDAAMNTPAEIWVAQGTYYPDEGASVTLNDRNETFQLINGVTLYGGFQGFEFNLSQRDWEAYVTILSGDINQSGTLDNNSYTVVTGSGTDETAVIDGLTITMGNADITVGVGSLPNRSGGGMYNNNGSPTVMNSTFSGNTADWGGGGMYNRNNSSPTVTNSTFSGNTANESGGGMFNFDNSSPTITNSTFSGNSALDGGGMLNFSNSSPTITNTTFTENTAAVGGGILNSGNSSPTITNSTFSGNTADFGGGGISNESSSSPTITNSTFSGNSALDGGGMENWNNSSPTITNTTFSGNTANESGGGMRNLLSSSPTVTNSTFSGNTAVWGGGMYNRNNSSPVITNSTFSGNTANFDGGGMFNENNSTPTIANSTFSGNTADWGGGMFNRNNSSTTITNSTFLGNMASFGGGMHNRDNSSPNITNSTFSGNKANWDGGGLYNTENSNPELTNTIIWNNSASDISNTPAASVVNFVGSSPVFQYCLVANSGGSGAWNTDIGVDGGNNIDTDPLFVEDIDPATAPTSAGNLQLTPCSPAINAGTPDTTGLNLTATDLAGNPRIAGDTIDMGPFEHGVLPCGWECPAGPVLFVTTSGGGSEDGSSWANAMPSLQDALLTACGCPEVTAIWVAEGTYYPDQGAFVTTLDRTETFQLCNNVSLYGGFTGTESNLSERDWMANETILSGDINQSGDHTGNSYTIVNGSGTDLTAVIDGFTITMGNANGSGSFSSPQRSGGGVYVSAGSPTIINCLISDNVADEDGGGIYNRLNSDPAIINSRIINNTAVFWGGGIANFNSSPALINLVISGNSAGSFGGGIYNGVSNPTIINSTITGNSAGNAGGGLRNFESNLTIVNSIIWNNMASGQTTTVSASVLNFLSTPTFEHCLVANSGGSASWESDIGVDGDNNIDTDPLFVEDFDPAMAPGDGGDFQLISCSEAIDAGLPDTSGLDLPPTDLAGNPRILRTAIDMGAYEFTGAPCGLECPEGSVIYVREGGDGDGSGSSWSNAMASLQDALQIACSCLDIEQVWVAAGTYYPDDGLFETTGDRESSFRLCNRVELLGGFPATGSPGLADRDWDVHETILSGDIGTSGDPDDNSYTVVSAVNVDSTSVLDGFTISDGNSDQDILVGLFEYGGGMFLFFSEPIIRNCLFRDNSARAGGGAVVVESAGFLRDYPVRFINCSFLDNECTEGLGGAVFNFSSIAHFSDCDFTDNSSFTFGGAFHSSEGNTTFLNGSFQSNQSESGGAISNGPFSETTLMGVLVEENFASGSGGGLFNAAVLHLENSFMVSNLSELSGGGMFLTASSTTFIENSEFIGNNSLDNAGGIYNESNNTVIARSVFQENFAVASGGAVMNFESSPTIHSSIFYGNTAQNYGGAILNNQSAPTVMNCQFTGNVAIINGGAISNETSSSPALVNCTFSGNRAEFDGGAIENFSFSSPTVLNTIFWNNMANGQTNTTSASVANFATSNPTFSYSLIANSNGSGAGWVGAIGDDGGDNIDEDPLFFDDFDPSDAPGTDGDFRLTSCSPAINAGLPGSEGIGLPPVDVAGNNRFINSIVDMGAYEQGGVPCGLDCIEGSTVYVTPSGAGDGDGRDWANAMSSLQDAFEVACGCFDIDQIWVAAGTYRPDVGMFVFLDHRAETFQLCNGVSIFGGFDGTETDLSERDWEANTTILSGVIGDPGDPEDNSLTIVTGSGTDSTAVLDGFWITGGRANSPFGGNTDPDLSGGGMYNLNGSPSVINCTFENNYAEFAGGAIFNFQFSSPIIHNCVFFENTADHDGGAMANFNDSSPRITNSSFTTNYCALYGGAIVNFTRSSPLIDSCTFQNNTADNSGGAIRSVFNCHPQILNSTFENNGSGVDGGALFNWDSSSPLISNSVFENNEAGQDGGAIFNIFNSSPHIINSTISNNEAQRDGGGISNVNNSGPTIFNSSIGGNIAGDWGGGVINSWNSSPTITNSTFSGNTANWGGGMYNRNNSSPTITNSTFSGNTANNTGGGLYNISLSNPGLTNTIIWNNSASGVTNTPSASVSNLDGSEPIFSHSLVANSGGSDDWNADIGVDNGNNIDANPLFVEDFDPAMAPGTGGDFQLTACSPAINAGTPDTTGLNLPLLDLAGNPRIFDDIVDMGAYEFQDLAPMPFPNPNIIFVDVSNPVPGSGRSWECAFNDLQLAIDVAGEGDSIWVAMGTYYPSDDPMDREATFQLKNGVVLYGGFTGVETLLSERDWVVNETILSGDINQSGDLDGNSYSVVTGSGTNLTAIIDGFTITMGNADVNDGPDSNPNRSGGGLYNNSGSPTVLNSNFIDNSANQYGGGIFNFENSNPRIINVSIINNNSLLFGGGIANLWGSSPTMINLRISGNTATSSGGGIFNFQSGNPILSNVTVSGNSAGFNGGGIRNAANSNPVLTNAIIWNNTASGVTNTPSASVSNSGDSEPTFLHSLIANSGGSDDWNADLGVDNGDNIDADPLFVEDFDPAMAPGTGGDFQLTACSPAINAGTPDTTGLNLPLLDLAGNPRIFDDIIDMGAYEFQDLAPMPFPNPNIIFVDVSSPISGSGRSWECAFNDLQLALDVAGEGDSIWVAMGTYYPSDDPMDREATFQLKNGVVLYGGFTGVETLLSERDWVVNETILSGDINQSDSLDGNSFTVVTGSGTDSTATLDGFIITMGNADGFGIFSNPQRSGGGIYNSGGSPTLVNCSIIGNRASDDGGGIFNRQNSNPTIVNCQIVNNTSLSWGGGIFNRQNSSPKLTNSTIMGNSSNWGGGIYNLENSSPTLKNLTIIANIANSGGGGVFNNDHSNPLFVNCRITGNSAGANGGGINNQNSSNPTIINSVISGNESLFTGGGVANFSGSSPEFTNTVIWNNSGAGETESVGSSVFNFPGTLISEPTFTYSLIANSGGSGAWDNDIGIDLGTNIDADPLFVEDFDPAMAPGTGGDFQLTECSPAINAGTPDTTGLNLPPLDLAGNPRIFDDMVDMGAYEFQGFSPHPEITCNNGSVHLDSDGEADLNAMDFIDVVFSCDSVNASFSPEVTMVNCADVGSSMYSIVAIDLNTGLSDSCEVEITVLDTVAPTALCQDVTVNLDATGNGSTTTAQVDNGSNDACVIQSLSLSQTDFDCGDLGSVQVTLTVEDNNGNTATCSANVTVEDNVAPTANCQDVTVNLDASGNGSTTAAEVDNGSDDACGIQSLSLSQTDFDCDDVGSVSVTLTVEDNNGNTATCSANVNVEDNIAPVAICQDVTVNLDASGSGSTTAAEVDNGSDDACGIQSLSLSQTDFDCGDVGNVLVTLTVEDNNGNTATCSANVTIEDNVAPTAVCQDVTVNLDATGNGSTTAAEVDNGSDDACGIQSLSLSQTDFDCGDIGTVQVTLTVEDNNGNTATCTANVSVEDNTPPDLSCAIVVSQMVANVGDPSVFVNVPLATATDNCSAVIVIENDYNANGADASDIYPVGSTFVTFTAEDDEGNTSTCVTEVIVVEDNSVVAVCQNITLSLDAMGALTMSADEVDGGSFGGTGSLSFEIGGESSLDFECSDVGTNPVILTVTDEVGESDDCNAVVTIEDNTPPIALCQDVTVNLDATGNGSITAGEVNNGSNDVCGIQSLSLSQTDFDCDDVGSVLVTLTVEDNNGNTATCSANVTVEDNVAPTANCQDVTVDLDASGNGSTTPAEVDNGSDDVCGIQSLSLSQTDFDCGDVGTVSITLTVEDNNGNTATCMANVSVLDQIDPSISCPADASILVPAGDTEGFVNLDPATADDNCPGVAITNDYNAGGADASDVYPVGVTTVTFTATDQSGHTAECQTQVTVTEDVIPGGTFELSGHISTTFGVNINNVEMVMTGDEMQIEFSNPMGLYDFLVEGGNSVTITPEKDENWLDGVSTFDVVLIQRHIVFLERFTNPYQIIAGDANDDGFISTFDLVLLQSLIVGSIDNIPGNTSWRFIPASYDFIDPENPLLESWPEQVIYPNVNSDLFDEDWVAMKTGDVSGDAGLSGIRRVAGNYSISAELMEREDSENWVVQFSPSELIDLSGYQLEIQWDPNKVSFLDFDISNTGLTNLGEHHFFIDGEAGIVRTNWWHGAGQILDPKEELFRLEFEPLIEGLNPENELKLAQRGSRWYSEAYRTSDDGLLNLSLNWKKTTAGEAYALYPNIPNPYREYTQIRFELPRAEEVKLTIWDQGGALLKQVDIEGYKGMNEFLLRANTLPAGVLYYRIEAGEWEASNKMIRME